MQVYKPLFLDFSPYEQHIFVHDEISLCFLDLVDLSIHKQRKTQASWVSATDSNGENNHFCPPAAFRASSESHVCKQPIFRSIILLLPLTLTGKAESTQITRSQEMSM